jgi:hypothetical protein
MFVKEQHHVPTAPMGARQVQDGLKVGLIEMRRDILEVVATLDIQNARQGASVFVFARNRHASLFANRGPHRPQGRDRGEPGRVDEQNHDSFSAF